MSIIKTQIVSSRPTVEVLFGDWEASGLAKYITEYNDLPIDFNIEWSADGLSRTRIETYDSALVPAIQTLGIQHADALQAEKVRRTEVGIVTVVTDLTPVVETPAETPTAE